MSDHTQIYTLPYRDFGGNVRRLRVRGRVSPRYWENILAECDGDEDADRFRVRVRGVKPRSAFEQCIRTHWVEEAQARALDEASKAEPVVLGLDFGLTSDKHGIGARQGFNGLDVEEWLPKDKPEEITMDAANRAIEWQRIYNAKFIVGDANGVGRGAMEFLAQYFHVLHPELNVRVIFFNAGARAHDDKRYYLRRDEIWHKRGRPWIANPRTHLPNVPGLKKQLCGPGYHEDTNKKISVESKKEMKKRDPELVSGNGADALLQTLAVETVVEAPKQERPPEHPPNFLRHFARLRRQQEFAEGKYIR
jgi:hypothetical protein